MWKVDTLKIVTGNLKPDVGRVEVAEKALSSFHTNEMARQVAFLPQVHEIPKDMTAEELVSCGRYPYQHWWTGVSTHDRDVIRSAMQRTNTLHLRIDWLPTYPEGNVSGFGLQWHLHKNRKF